jgi:hypothetical protein
MDVMGSFKCNEAPKRRETMNKQQKQVHKYSKPEPSNSLESNKKGKRLNLKFSSGNWKV